MALPYKVATLLYAFNQAGETLLLERCREPNLGFWSPAGGKLDLAVGESPYTCACREAAEELGVVLTARDLHLAGMVSERGYEGQAHWLMFLFEIKRPLTAVPPPHPEGVFRFFPLAELTRLRLPRTDREQIWPLFLKYRGGFFSAHCHCHSNGRDEWTIEEAAVPTRPGLDPAPARF